MIVHIFGDGGEDGAVAVLARPGKRRSHGHVKSPLMAWLPVLC